MDGRRPESVTFSSAEEDAKRRDFTINGMLYDPLADQVVDFVGGKSDLENHLVRAIGNPDERFAEDHLRLLRAVRFAAALEFEIEPATWQAVIQNAEQIKTVIQERIRDELVKIIAQPHPVRGLPLPHQTVLLPHILRAVSPMNGGVQRPRC